MTHVFENAEIVFQESFASGHSHKNIFCMIGGARNCLRLVVTQDFLCVTSWFPVSLITPFYDLEHLIPLDAITSIRRSGIFFQNAFRITYQDANGKEHTLTLYSWHPNDFERSLRAKRETDAGDWKR